MIRFPAAAAREANSATSASLIAAEALELGVQVTRIGAFSTGKGLSARLEEETVNLPERLGFEHD